MLIPWTPFYHGWFVVAAYSPIPGTRVVIFLAGFYNTALYMTDDYVYLRSIVVYFFTGMYDGGT